MNISSETLLKWKSLYQVGDKTKIAEMYQAKYQKASLSTVQGWVWTAFKTGFAPENLFDIIDSYYKKVENKLKKSA